MLKVKIYITDKDGSTFIFRLRPLTQVNKQENISCKIKMEDYLSLNIEGTEFRYEKSSPIFEQVSNFLEECIGKPLRTIKCLDEELTATITYSGCFLEEGEDFFLYNLPACS